MAVDRSIREVQVIVVEPGSEIARIDTEELKRDLREQGEQASTGCPAA